jgi:hypothetical protein
MPPESGDWHTVKIHHWDDSLKISIVETEKGICQSTLFKLFVSACVVCK